MRFINTMLNPKSNLMKGALDSHSLMFIMDEKPESKSEQEWYEHCVANVRSQAYTYSNVSLKVSCSIVTGILDGKAYYATSPSLNLTSTQHTFNTLYRNYNASNSSLAYHNISQTVNKHANWEAYKLMFFTGRGGAPTRRPSQLISIDPSLNYPFLIYPWKNPSAALKISSTDPTSKVDFVYQESSNEYRNRYRTQQGIYIYGTAFSATQDTKNYTYTIGTSIPVTTSDPFMFDPLYVFTDCGRRFDCSSCNSNLIEDINQISSSPRKQQFSSLKGETYFAVDTTEPDSISLSCKYAVAAYQFVGKTYIQVYENGIDFNAANTQPGQKVELTMNQPPSLGLRGDLIMNLQGKGAH